MCTILEGISVRYNDDETTKILNRAEPMIYLYVYILYVKCIRVFRFGIRYVTHCRKDYRIVHHIQGIFLYSESEVRLARNTRCRTIYRTIFFLISAEIRQFVLIFSPFLGQKKFKYKVLL